MLDWNDRVTRHTRQTVLINVRTKSMWCVSGLYLCRLAGLEVRQDLKSCEAPANAASRPFDAALEKAIKLYGRRKLQVHWKNASDALTTLTWLYASTIVRPYKLVQRFDSSWIGVGADATIFGVDHTSVVSETMAALAPDRIRAQAQAWRSVLALASASGKMCERAVCLLRGVVHNDWLSAAAPYRQFAAQEAIEASASGAHYLNPLNATLDGISSGVFAHPDLLRIHYNDRGRAFLAQLVLNALAILLPKRNDSDADRTHRSDARLRLQEAAPQHRNLWEACRHAVHSEDARLASACDACAPCRNETLEKASRWWA
jgi:hypothetical protein